MKRNAIRSVVIWMLGLSLLLTACVRAGRRSGPETAGADKAATGLPHSTAIGVVRGDKPLLNPDAKYMLDKSDKLIVIAQDESKIEIRDAAAVDENVFEREPNMQEEPHTLLVLGYTDMLKQILIEDDAYAAPGSKVIFAAESGKIDLDALPSKDELKNIEVCVRECRIYKRHVLEKLLAEKPSSIMLRPSISDTVE